jgi:hypothetical protein
MPDPAVFVYCPHIIEATKQQCGVGESGRGRVTKIPIPPIYLDGKTFIIECPACNNDILVKPRLAQDDEDAIEEDEDEPEAEVA